MSRLAVLMVVLFAFGDTIVLAQSLSVSTDFEGGAGEVAMVDQQRRSVTVMPPIQNGRGWPCWWYIRIDGLSSGESCVVTVSANRSPWKGTSVLSHQWALPDRASFSFDKRSWQHSAPGTRNDASISYRIVANGEQIWVAWGPPWTPADADKFLSELDQRSSSSTRFVLATTRSGRQVNAIRFGRNPSADVPVPGIWVQARQHAWEAGSSWVGKGFAEWVVGDSPEAEWLRSNCAIYYVPIMDVDNVAVGAGGKEAIPRDHNRDWSAEPYYPEVAAAQRHIAELNEQGCFDVFVDLHNPGAGERRPYYFGPHLMSSLPSIQQRNHARWLAMSCANMTGPLQVDEKYHIASYIKTDEERGRMSQNWVRNHTDSHVLSTTLETAWNTKNSVTSGYETLGEQLGQTIAGYIRQRPREFRE